jgi:hypothetical protein
MYSTKNAKGEFISVNGREKNLLLSIYGCLDIIAESEEWEDFWKKEYNIDPPGEYSSNRKVLWILEDKKWVYPDMHEVDISLPSEVVENLIKEAIELVKSEQKRKSKFLESLTPQKAREFLELFNAFEWA